MHVMFRLVGGCIPLIPPLNPPLSLLALFLLAPHENFLLTPLIIIIIHYLPSKHCIVWPMLARCSCQHLSNSAQRCSQCWGDAVLHQSPAFSQHWHSAAGRHRNLRRADNGGIMFPTSARSWQTAANQHRNSS